MNAVVKSQDAVPMVHNESATLLSLIAKVAADPNADIDKMDRLLQMHQRVEAQQAEREFNQALNGAQSEMGRIKANKRNTQTSSNYADYAALDRAIRGTYLEHGFSLSFTTENCGDAAIRVVGYLRHRDGHKERYEVEMPADGKGAKGGDVMTKTHATGSAISYGKRYLLIAMFNLAVGEDDDGNAAGGKFKPTAPAAGDGQPMSGVWESMDKDQKGELLKIALSVGDYVDSGEVAAAVTYIEQQKLTTEEKAALWSRLDSTHRTALKKAAKPAAVVAEAVPE